MRILLPCFCLLLGLSVSWATGKPNAPAAGPRIVTVAGNVRAPGPLPWVPEMKLTLAIKRAGGIGWESGNFAVEIQRGTERIRVRIRELVKMPESAPLLKPGDVVVVDPE